MKALTCTYIPKDSLDQELTLAEALEEINEDYHAGECQIVNLQDLVYGGRRLVLDMDDVVIVIEPK